MIRSNPSIWQCRVESKSLDLEVSTTAHLTIDPPSEFISVKLDGESQAAEIFLASATLNVEAGLPHRATNLWRVFYYR